MSLKHGSLNVPIEHHPTIRYMVYNGYYKLIYGSHHALSLSTFPVTQQVPHLLNKGLHRVRIQQVQQVHLRVVPQNDWLEKKQ